MNRESVVMKCHVCGSVMKAATSVLPFKLSDTSVVVLRDLPILQCENCNEYLLEDSVMARVEEILASTNGDAELAVIRFAA
jgi:YgiT-type zinc finger domain-containing protein